MDVVALTAWMNSEPVAVDAGRHAQLAVRVGRLLDAHRRDHEREVELRAADRRRDVDVADVDEDASVEPPAAERRHVVDE